MNEDDYMTDDDYWTIYIWPTERMTHDQFLEKLNQLDELGFGWETV